MDLPNTSSENIKLLEKKKNPQTLRSEYLKKKKSSINFLLAKGIGRAEAF